MKICREIGFQSLYLFSSGNIFKWNFNSSVWQLRSAEESFCVLQCLCCCFTISSFQSRKFGFKGCTYRYYLVRKEKKRTFSRLYHDKILIKSDFLRKGSTTWMLYIIRSELWYIIAFIIQSIKISEYLCRICGLNKNIRQNSFSEVFVSTEQEHNSPLAIDEIPILGLQLLLDNHREIEKIRIYSNSKTRRYTNIRELGNDQDNCQVGNRRSWVY